MLPMWYEGLRAQLTPASWRHRSAARRHQRRWQPRLEPLEPRLVLYDHIWSHGTGGAEDPFWSLDATWSNGSPAGDPDPAGAVVIFPEDAGSDWDQSYEDIPGELPVKSLYYHRGGFETDLWPPVSASLLLSQDIYTDLGATNSVSIPIRFTSEPSDSTHLIQVNDTGELDLTGDLTGGPSTLVDKEGTGTLLLGGHNDNYTGTIALHQGTLRLGSASALASGTPLTALDGGATLDLNGFNLTASVQTDVNGTIQLGSGNLSFASGSRTAIDGAILGSGTLNVDGTDAQVELGPNGTFASTLTTTVTAGTLWVDAPLPNLGVAVGAGGTLRGGGTVGSVDVAGLLHPGSLSGLGGVLTSQGSVVFDAGSTFVADIRGSAAGQYDQLTAMGTIDLSNGPSLVVTGGNNSAEGDSLTIVHSSAGLVGTFAGLPDGAVLTAGHTRFRINYTNTDVTLTHLPQFAPPTYYPDGDSGGPHGLARGDFNGDGILDLVAVNNSPSASLTVLLGNGDGTFQSASPIAIPGQPLAVTVGDFNNDGILDLAVAAGINGGTVYVLLGNGDGTFQAPAAYAVGAYPTDIEVADVNGDGNQDLVVLNQNANSISILYGNGDGTFQSAATMTFPGFVTTALAFLPDLNSGRVDLVVGNETGVYGAGSVISVMVNLGNDSYGHAIFQDAMDYPTHSYINALAVADFNGDGIPDVLWVAPGVAGPGGVGVYLGTRDGLFQSTPIISTTGASGSAVAVGDFNGDGTLDIAIPAGDGAGSPGLIVLYGHGDGSFGPPSIYAVNGGYDPPIGVLAGDFNSDGAPDLAVLTEYFGLTPGHVAILLNMGFGGGPAPHGPGRAPRHAWAAIDLAAVAFQDAAGSPGAVTAPLPRAPGTATPGPASPPTIAATPAASARDRFFALLAGDESRPAFAPGRPWEVLTPERRLAWDMERDGWLRDGPLAGTSVG